MKTLMAFYHEYICALVDISFNHLKMSSDSKVDFYPFCSPDSKLRLKFFSLFRVLLSASYNNLHTQQRKVTVCIALIFLMKTHLSV